MNYLLHILVLLLLSLFLPDSTSAACPNTINNTDITITSSDNCSLSALSTYYIDKATSELSNTNDGSLTLIGGSLTIANTAKLVVGRLVPTGGTIIIQNGGSIDVYSTPTWVADGDADGYPLDFTTYTATAPGRRRLGLMRATTDCNDGSSQVFLGVAQCHHDADGDSYTAGLAPNSTCLNTPSCDTATRASASTHGAAVTSYTAGRLRNSASASLDCYDSNANARPNQTSCFTTSRGDGSYDYNCNGASTKCSPILNYSSGLSGNYVYTRPCIGGTGNRSCGSRALGIYNPITSSCGQTAATCTGTASEVDCSADGTRCYRSDVGSPQCTSVSVAVQSCN